MSIARITRKTTKDICNFLGLDKANMGPNRTRNPFPIISIRAKLSKTIGDPQVLTRVWSAGKLVLSTIAVSWSADLLMVWGENTTQMRSILGHLEILAHPGDANKINKTNFVKDS